VNASEENLAISSYTISFSAKRPKTIKILAQYTKATSAEELGRRIGVAKRNVTDYANSYGWSWVKTEVDQQQIGNL
jgi:hypothetical protein